jgi:gliding motility-associated-like protein
VSPETTIKIDLMPANPSSPVVSVVTQPTCNDPNGTVEVTSPKEGTGYEYSIDGQPYQVSATFTGLKWGTHSVLVRSISTGCESFPATNITINAIPPPPVLTFVSENPQCFGDPGSISFAMTNTINGVYIIKYDGGQFSNVTVTNGAATVTAYAGTYSNLTIESNGCTSDKVGPVEITQPSEIVITETITEIDLKSNTKGAINIVVTGGTPFSVTDPYQYKWNNGLTTRDIKNLNEGTYVVLVTDKNGCTQEKLVRIPAPNYPPVARDDEFTSGCSGASGNLFADNGKGIDYDPENDPFFVDVTPIESPKQGKLTIDQATGSFVYLANPGFEGLDMFRYAIYDKNHYQGDTATVIIHVVSDFDGDGIPDLADADADADGILNLDEVVKGGNWKTTDSDGDGHLNWLDIDADNDGIVDNVEAQSTSGYIAPSGTINIDGVDLAYDPAQGGTKIILLDTDLTLADPDGIPDFLDPDSDNDWVPDYIEGHDQDADGKPDRILSGKDSDSDGLDEAYDIVVNGCNNGNSTGSNSPLQDFDGDGMNDWRDENDDDDEYLTRFEDLNADGDYSNDVTGHVGHPEYLWYGRDCELFIPDAFSPNYDNIHDYFQIYCIESYPNAQMYIFDQVGNKLYEKEHYGNMNVHKTADEAWWDGTTSNRSATRNGNKVVPGTYYYVLRLGNGEVKKSFVFVSY